MRQRGSERRRGPRYVAAMLTLLLLACATPTDDTAATCDGTTGTLRVCVWMSEGDPTVLTGAHAWVAVDEAETDAVQTYIGDDGCAEFELKAGEWWAWGRDDAQNCRSSPEAATVDACATTELQAYIAAGCVDGG